MLTELDPTELTAALSCVRHSLAQMPSANAIDTYLTSVHSHGVIVRDSSPPTKLLRDVIAAYSECLTPDAAERLQTIPVFCHNLPICNAVARRSRGGNPFVLFYSGLLAVAGYRQSLAILTSNLELMLEQKSNDVARAKRALSEIVAPAQALSYWFYVTPLALPDCNDIFSDAHKTQLTHGLGCAAMFVMLHEVGHIMLGHLDGQRPPAPQIITNYVDENIDTWKMMEFSADAFAIAGIKPTLKTSFVTSVFIILDLISDIECFCLPRKGSHPYVVNRVNNLASILELESDTFYAEVTESLLSQKKALLAERAKAFPAATWEGASQGREANAVEAFTQLLPSQEECLFAFDTLKSMYDGVDYLGPHVAGR